MQTHNTMRRKEPLQVVAEQQQQQRVGEGSLSTFAVATNDTPTYRSVPEVKLFGRARAAGVLVLLVSAVTVATLAYQLLSCNEEQGFRKQFDSSARQVMFMANRNVINAFTSFDTMAAMYPSHAAKSNERLPFVTIDSFDALVDGFRNLSKASLVHFSPLLRTEADVLKWNRYSKNQTSWIAEGRRARNHDGANVSDEVSSFAFEFGDESDDTYPATVQNNRSVVPTWQMAPLPPQLNMINHNAFQSDVSRLPMEYASRTGKPSLTEPNPTLRHAFPLEVEGPLSLLHVPVYRDVTTKLEKDVVGYLTGLMAWKVLFDDILPPGHDEVLVVVESCSVKNTFLIRGPAATFLGDGDLHNPIYNSMKESQYLVGTEANTKESTQCQHQVHVFPTAVLEHAFVTNAPVRFGICIFAIFAFLTAVFLLADYFIRNRQQHQTEQQACQNEASVERTIPVDFLQSLFPGQDAAAKGSGHVNSMQQGHVKVDSKTITGSHPEATVLFADISGFAAWSATRDTNQIFTFFESVFQAFDAIAEKHGISRGETIGDCYVAVSGVPNSNPRHAATMSRFARSIMRKFSEICRIQARTLGADTRDLALRVGIHSGPVTTGVSQGERARFQLFGDTVNTASRLESTGRRECVHISEQTALQLTSQGKEDWIVKRDDNLDGKVVTYWLKLSTNSQPIHVTADPTSPGSASGGNCSLDLEKKLSKTTEDNQKNQRFIHCTSEVLLELLERVVSRRDVLRGTDRTASQTALTHKACVIGRGTTIVEEVVDIIHMPMFACLNTEQHVPLSDVVVRQLRDFVVEIASMYNDNPFHNFEHASNSAMSVYKLFGRIADQKIAHQHAIGLHDHTCGIGSDPLIQFAVVLAALIHDLDHPGVSNCQYVKEDRKLAERYKEKCVAVQRSVDLAWNVLVQQDYNELRAAIFSTELELRRFRNALVNSAIAADIFDKDLGTLRKHRWNKAFHQTTPDETPQKVQSRKATIIMEHLIQASDVTHTTQQWQVYQKWNQRLFDEAMTAYRAGRAEKDPSEDWYISELLFFDNHVIPLLRKLKDCSVFGVSSSDEYMTYAIQNRREWEAKGLEIVEQYTLEFDQKKSREHVEIQAAHETLVLI